MGADITVDDMLDELAKHVPSSKQSLLTRRGDELRSSAIDLNEFGKRVRMIFGADLLVRTLEGLHALRDARARGEDGADDEGGGSSKSPLADKGVKLRDEDHSAKVLIHALLCPSHEVQSSVQAAEVETMKGFLQRLEAHANSCGTANMPGGKSDCPTCAKWHKLERLRDLFAKKLVKKARLERRPSSVVLDEKAGASLERKGSGSSVKSGSDSPAGSRGPPSLKRNLSVIMRDSPASLREEAAETAGELLPGLIDGALAKHRQRRDMLTPRTDEEAEPAAEPKGAGAASSDKARLPFPAPAAPSAQPGARRRRHCRLAARAFPCVLTFLLHASAARRASASRPAPTPPLRPARARRRRARARRAAATSARAAAAAWPSRPRRPRRRRTTTTITRRKTGSSPRPKRHVEIAIFGAA